MVADDFVSSEDVLGGGKTKAKTSGGGHWGHGTFSYICENFESFLRSSDITKELRYLCWKNDAIRRLSFLSPG